MIRVWHTDDTDFISTPTSISKNKVLVAEVDTNDLNRAFELTNTIEHYWWTNALVIKITPAIHVRSTSVGDFMEKDGKWYAVSAIGFTEMKEE